MCCSSRTARRPPRRPVPMAAYAGVGAADAAGAAGGARATAHLQSPRRRRAGARGRQCRGGRVGGTSSTDDARRILAELRKAVLGQDGATRDALVGLLARGHVLLEGVPGTAKTLLVRALALSL